MFDNTFCIRFEKDKEKFKKRAEELGYVLYVDLDQNKDNGIIILWYKYGSIFGKRSYSIISYTNTLGSIKEISQEEFFGVKMLEKLDLRVLSVLVNLTCETLNSFSSYDVTSILRSRLPNFNILHEDVKKEVEKYVDSNKLLINDNGTYKVYTSINKSTPITITTTSTGVNTNSFTNMSKLNLLRQKKEVKKVVDLQSEGRLNLTSLVKKYFPGYKNIYVTKEPNKILLTVNPYKNSSLKQFEKEFRIRTGFITNKAQVNVSQGKVEITQL